MEFFYHFLSNYFLLNGINRFLYLFALLVFFCLKLFYFNFIINLLLVDTTLNLRALISFYLLWYLLMNLWFLHLLIWLLNNLTLVVWFKIFFFIVLN